MPPFPHVEGARFAHVPGFPGYAASDDGRIWSCRPCRGKAGWRELRLQRQKNGYLSVMLCVNAKPRKQWVHRLVLLAFVGPPGESQETLHGPDHDRTNNRLANLSWGTRKANMDQCCAAERQNRGERNGRARYTEAQIREVFELRAKGNSQRQIANETGIDRRYVNSVLNRKRWKYLSPQLGVEK